MLVGFGAGLGCAIAAGCGVFSLWANQSLQTAEVLNSWRTWWLGDATGLLLFAPLLLTIARSRRPWLPDGRMAELFGIGLSLTGLCVLLLMGATLPGREEQILFLVYPLLVWAGLRFGCREVAIVNFASFLIVALAAELGVWELRHADALLMQLQMLFMSGAISGLLLAAAVEAQQDLVAAVQQSERRYRQLSELSRDVISRHALDGRFLFVSAACEPMLGLAAHQLLGRNYCEFCHPADRPQLQEYFVGIAHGVARDGCCIRFQHRDGHYLWLEIVFNRVAQGDSGQAEVVMVSRDVTRRKLDDAELQESEERYRKLIEMMPDALVLHKNGVIYFANNELMHMLEVSQLEQLIGRHVNEFLCSNSRSLSAQRLASLAVDQQLPCAEMTLVLPDGRSKDIEISSSTIRLWGDQYVITLVRDVSERKRAESQRRLSAKVFEVAMESIVILDSQFVPVSINPAFEHILGYGLAELAGQPLQRLSQGLHDDTFFSRLRARLAETGRWQGEMALRCQTGAVLTELVSISCLQDDAGSASHYVAVFADITYLKQAEDAYRTRANYDTLTHLPNRALLQERLGQILARARSGQEQFALLFVDLDGFKLINDTLGHEMGDTVLRTLAARMADCVRRDDTVARLGGDEFVILLEGRHESTLLAQSVERLIDVVQRPILGHGQPVSVTASIGVAVYPDDGREIDELLRSADRAMYCAKRLGKNRYCLSSELPAVSGQA